MARVKKIQEEASPDWQTIFCSLTIILVAFFVMLCAMATPERGKMVEIRRSFRAAVSIFDGGLLFEKGRGLILPSPDNSGKDIENIVLPIYELLRGKGLEDKITLRSSREFVSLMLIDSLVFHENSTKLTPAAEKILSFIANIVSGFSDPIVIEGHTDDSLPASRTHRSNWELSAMRAVNVMRFFIESCGIDPQRISAAGFAQYKPFVPNKTDEDRKINSRVEIIIPVFSGSVSERGNIILDSPPSFKVWDLSRT